MDVHTPKKNRIPAKTPLCVSEETETSKEIAGAKMGINDAVGMELQVDTILYVSMVW